MIDLILAQHWLEHAYKKTVFIFTIHREKCKQNVRFAFSVCYALFLSFPLTCIWKNDSPATLRCSSTPSACSTLLSLLVTIRHYMCAYSSLACAVMPGHRRTILALPNSMSKESSKKVNEQELRMEPPPLKSIAQL